MPHSATVLKKKSELVFSFASLSNVIVWAGDDFLVWGNYIMCSAKKPPCVASPHEQAIVVDDSRASAAIQYCKSTAGMYYVLGVQ